MDEEFHEAPWLEERWLAEIEPERMPERKTRLHELLESRRDGAGRWSPHRVRDQLTAHHADGTTTVELDETTVVYVDYDAPLPEGVFDIDPHSGSRPSP